MDHWLIQTSDNRISLHDHRISCVAFHEDVVLYFEDGFDVLADNSGNPTGRHQLTGEAAVILRNGRYLCGSFEGIGTDKDGNEFERPVLQIAQQDIVKYEIEVLSYQIELKDNRVNLEGFSCLTGSTYSPYCVLTFSCTEILYGWNAFVGDAWFQK